MPTGIYKRTAEHNKKNSEAKKGNKFWQGKKHKQESKEKMRLAKLNEKNPSLSFIHKTIEKKYGNPNYCEHCKRSDKKKYEWSNKDHKYRLKKEDWQRLCTSCHRKYDIKNNK